jgi:formylglycine-generating enzyme required for sulfatase activity
MKSSIIRSVLAILFIAATAHAQCPGDVIPNGVVNGTDLAEVLASWGPCSSCSADTNRDGQVNGQDLAAVSGGWGACRPIIDSITPNVGSTSGGHQVTISGRYLSGTTLVTVGGVPASAVTFVSNDAVRLITPPGSPGLKTVQLTTPSGTTSFESGFNYVTIGVPSWSTLIEEEPNPTVVIDPFLRASISATGFAWRVRDTATQIEMVLIPPGTFQMGCSDSVLYSCNGDEWPRHTVTLTQPLYLGRYEVTQAQWTAQMGWNPSWFQSPSPQVPSVQVLRRPVERVSWEMIQGFLSATGMRLPTEAEWEYSYRAGTSTAFHSMPGHPSGTNEDSLLGDIAWFGDNSLGQTRPVGQKASNGFGLHDMSGNVWEWVSDLYDSNYYASSPTLDPQGPMTGLRVIRGNGYMYGSNGCRSSFRGISYLPNDAHSFLGFRVARNP